MRQRDFRLLMVIIMMITVFGCSKNASNPTLPKDNAGLEPANPQALAASEDGRVFFGLYDATFDPGLMKFDIVPSRNTSMHINVTSYLFPPKCSDCVKYKVINYNRLSQTLNVDITIKNPTSVVGYDVRGIVYSTDAVKRPLYNADDWTPLWDIPGGDKNNINPFKSFCHETTKRRINGGGSSTANFKLYFPALMTLQLAFDASWPGNCEEPYELKYFKLLYPLADFVEAETVAEIQIFDWQDDITSAVIWAPALDTYSAFPFHKVNKMFWQCQFVNNNAAVPGVYEGLIIATSSGKSLYDYVKFTVGPSGWPIEIYEFCNIPFDPTSEQINGIAVDSKKIYVPLRDKVSEQYNMRKVDKITCQPETLAIYPWSEPEGEYPYAIAVSDDYIYFVAISIEHTPTLFICDKENLSEISRLELVDMHILDIVLDGDQLWAASGNIDGDVVKQGIVVINVKDPYHPFVQYNDTSVNAFCIAIQNEWVYVGCYDDTPPTLKILNKEDGYWYGTYTAPFMIFPFYDVVVSGVTAYVGYANEPTLAILSIDVSDVENPVLLNQISPLPHPASNPYYRLALNGGKLYAALMGKYLDVFDVYTPGSETYNTYYLWINILNDLKVDGDYLFLSSDHDLKTLQITWE